jgi:hypothetical protein
MEIQDAFLTTPGLTMSPSDAVRRFDADHVTCEAILQALVDARVLVPAANGGYESGFALRHRHRPRGPASSKHPAAA